MNKKQVINELEKLKRDMPRNETEENVWLIKAANLIEIALGTDSTEYAQICAHYFWTAPKPADDFWKEPYRPARFIDGSREAAAAIIDGAVRKINSNGIARRKRKRPDWLTWRNVIKYIVLAILTIIGAIAAKLFE